MVVIVSEETGIISVAVGGMLKRGLTPETLQKLLRTELQSLIDDEEEDSIFEKVRRWLGRKKSAQEEAEHEETEHEEK